MRDDIEKAVLRAIQSKRDPNIYGATYAAAMNEEIARKAADTILASMEKLTDLLRQVDHTLIVHGHVDRGTDLHGKIDAAIQTTGAK